MVDELELGGLASSVAREWEDLAERLDAPPFLRPGWIDAWLDAFGKGELRLIEVRRENGDELAAALPMLRSRGALRSPSNWHTPAFGCLAMDVQAGDELLRRLFAEPCASIELSLLDGDRDQPEAVARIAREGGRLVTSRALVRSPFIELTGSFEDYEQSLSRNRRKALRQRRRKLEREGTLRFEVHDGSENLEELFGQLCDVESAGWKGKNGTAISSRPNTRRFYEAVARWGADNGWLRIAFLRLDGRAIACDLALEHSGVWYTLKAGYDEEFRAFGPGALLLRDEIAHCYEQGVSRMELLGEEDSFKASWTESCSERVWLQAFNRTPAGIAGWAAIATRERIRPLARTVRRLGR